MSVYMFAVVIQCFIKISNRFTKFAQEPDYISICMYKRLTKYQTKCNAKY